jgi:hypothetical protein
MHFYLNVPDEKGQMQEWKLREIPAEHAGSPGLEARCDAEDRRCRHAVSEAAAIETAPSLSRLGEEYVRNFTG